MDVGIPDDPLSGEQLDCLGSLAHEFMDVRTNKPVAHNCAGMRVEYGEIHPCICSSLCPPADIAFHGKAIPNPTLESKLATERDAGSGIASCTLHTL